MARSMPRRPLPPAPEGDGPWLFRGGIWIHADEDEHPWTDEDEAGLEEFEERRRERIALANEF